MTNDKRKKYMKKYREKKKTEKKKPENKKNKKVFKGKPFCYVTSSGKTFRQKQLDKFAIKSEDSKQIKDEFSKQYGKKGLIEPLYNPASLAALLEINTYHARCCIVKAQDTAGIGYKLISPIESPNQQKKTEIENFFTSQRPTQTVLITRMQKDFESLGYGALEFTRVGNIPTGLPRFFHHIPAHTLRIHTGGNKFAQIRGTKIRWFKRINYDKDINFKDGKEYALGSLTPEQRATEILWITDYTARSDYYGLPSIAPAIGAIYGDLGRRDYNIAFFSNFGVPAYAVFISGDFDPGPEDADGKTELEKVIGDHLETLVKNPHSTLLLSVPTRTTGEGKVEINFVPLSTGVKEASFRLFRRDNKDEVMVAHGVPPYRVGINETGSLGGNTAKESTEIYKMSVIEPRQVIIEESINQEIIWHENGFNTKDWKYKLLEIDTTDEIHDKEMMTFLFDCGAITIREIISNFAGKYGLKDDGDDPVLDMRFIHGQAITGEFANTGDFKEIIKSLRKKLLERVEKNEGFDNNSGDREILKTIKNLESMGQMGNKN